MNVPFLDISRQNKDVMDESIAMFKEIFQKNAFIGGECVLNFERLIQEYLKVRNVVTCGNGTDALVLALRACGVGTGDEVITTPFTFFATAEAIALVGAKPVFADILPESYLVDPDRIEEKITKKTKAILPVHIFGACCDMERIMEMADNHSVKVIEDAAQAIGAEYKGRKAGTLGHMAAFSFYPTKNLGGCGDGGMVATDADNLGLIASALHVHGAGKRGARAFEILSSKKEKNERLTNEESASALYDPYKYYNYLIGYNSRLDALQAAVLSVKLGKLDDYNNQRERIAERYTRGLCEAVKRPKYSDDVNSCWHQYAICTDKKYELCDYLKDKGIGVGTFYPVPLHLQKAFADLRYKAGDLPIAERICNETVCLPIYPGMTDDEVDYVIENVNAFWK